MNNWLRVKMAESMGGASLFTLWQEILAGANQKDLIFCIFDGVNSRKKRKAIYPAYKAKRKPADQSIYDGMKFFKELLKYAPINVKTVEVPEYEADDVIATITVKMASNDDKMDIVSTDRDLTQLRISPNIGTLKEPAVEPKWVKTYKMLVGDPSDNIPGVKGFGEAAWNKLSDYAKDFLTVFFYLEYGKEEDLVLFSDLLQSMQGSLENLLAEELSEVLANKIADAYHSGELQTWYNLVSFIPVPVKDIQEHFFAGNGQIDMAQEKLGTFSLTI